MKMGSSSLEKYDCLERRQVTLFLNFADEFKFHDTHTSKICVSKNQMPEMPSYLHQEILLKLMLLFKRDKMRAKRAKIEKRNQPN